MEIINNLSFIETFLYYIFVLYALVTYGIYLSYTKFNNDEIDLKKLRKEKILNKISSLQKLKAINYALLVLVFSSLLAFISLDLTMTFEKSEGLILVPVLGFALYNQYAINIDLSKYLKHRNKYIYNKFEKDNDLFFLLRIVIYAGILVFSIFGQYNYLLNKTEEIKKAFNKGSSVICKETVVSLNNKYKVKGLYFIKDEKAIKIYKCNMPLDENKE